MKHPLVLAITGASGAVYARRLLEVLMASGHQIHLTISPSGKLVLRQELGIDLSAEELHPEQILQAFQITEKDDSSHLLYHQYDNMMAPIASGSSLTSGMVICPCSSGTLSSVVHGTSSNLIHRAADVHLKERRRLIMVPRETPLSIVQLDNMRRACEAGAIVLPASPGWYHGVTQVEDLIDFVVARILDQLEVENTLMNRWGEQAENPLSPMLKKR